jgi:integrase/recombinase XerD
MQSDSLLDGFLRHVRVERGLSENSCLSYRYQLGAYVAFLRARSQEIATATPDDVLAFLEHRRGEGLKSSSLFVAAIAVRQFHRHLVEAGRAAADPTKGMRLPRFKQRIPEPVSAERVVRLLRVPVGAKFGLLRDHAMLELMYATGMRVSELTGLRPAQVDLGGAGRLHEQARPTTWHISSGAGAK